MNSNIPTVRNMSRSELDVAVEWALKEGWNPGIHDADCFWAQDPNGFFVETLGDKIIATISAVRYGETYGFMGFYIVKPEFRGKGHGMKLFNHAWKYLGNRNIGGDGVIENLPKYAKVGLKLEHYNARYEGKGCGSNKLQANVVPVSMLNIKDLFNYDGSVFGFPRNKFLKLWINRLETKTLGYVKNGQLKGYGAIRKCFSGFKIGPLFANTDDVASSLFESLLNQVKLSDSVFFDLPECNKHSLKMANQHKMTKVFATGRIYTKGQPNFPLKKWYGITSFELG